MYLYNTRKKERKKERNKSGKQKAKISMHEEDGHYGLNVHSSSKKKLDVYSLQKELEKILLIILSNEILEEVTDLDLLDELLDITTKIILHVESLPRGREEIQRQ